MHVVTEFFRSKGRKINKSYDMVRLIIDLPRIEGLKLKKELEKK